MTASPASLDMIERLIGFDTTSSKSNLALIDAVAAYLAEHGITTEIIASDDGTRVVVGRMMEEAKRIGEKLGVRFALSVEARIETAKEVGAHKTSMLQDLELGRPMELEALTGAVIELGRLVDEPTPTIELVYYLTRQRAREGGCYPEAG